MTLAISKDAIQRQLQTFTAQEAAARQAMRSGDVRQANRRLVKMWRALDALSSGGPRGKDAVEALLVSPTGHVRLRAGAAVLKWDPDLAVPVLGRLLFEEFEAGTSPDERVEVRISASELLFAFFNVKPDRNNLIVPLEKYGVELPHRDHDRWKSREIPTSPVS